MSQSVNIWWNEALTILNQILKLWEMLRKELEAFVVGSFPERVVLRRSFQTKQIQSILHKAQGLLKSAPCSWTLNTIDRSAAVTTPLKTPYRASNIRFPHGSGDVSSAYRGALSAKTDLRVSVQAIQ